MALWASAKFCLFNFRVAFEILGKTTLHTGAKWGPANLKGNLLSFSGPPLALVVLGAWKLSQNFQGPHF